jgi:hypothetical protein
LKATRRPPQTKLLPLGLSSSTSKSSISLFMSSSLSASFTSSHSVFSSDSYLRFLVARPLAKPFS